MTTTTLTLSPSNSNSPFSFHRRGSIRRGTISSISKDIRVNDFVEIIKQHKLIQEEKRRQSLKPITFEKEASSSSCTTLLPELSQLEQLQQEFTTVLKDLHIDQQNMDKIKQGQSILTQQQHLLQQLLPPSPSTLLNKPTSTLLTYFNKPKPTTTHIVIKQTADKNEFNTIFSLQGICTTIEASYIPHQLSSQIPPSTLYHFHYSLNLTYHDRADFSLLAYHDWQKDHTIKTCQEKNCNVTFNFFQRKHHCRRCGLIFCHTHSRNRLPLFTNTTRIDQPIFSRVCDACFYSLTSNSLSLNA